MRDQTSVAPNFRRASAAKQNQAMQTPTDTPAQEERLQAIADAIVEAANAAGIGLIVTAVDDPDHRPIYVSDAAARVLGYSAEELLERPLLSLIASDERLHMQDISDRARRRERGPTLFETAVRTKDGRRVPIEVSVANTHLDGRRIAVTFVVDITERIHAEAALVQSEALFRRLIDSAPEAIWILDENALCFANAAAAELFGFAKQDAAGRSMRDFMHPEEIPAHEARRRLLLQRRERLPAHEYRARRSDGRWLNLEVSSMAIEFEGRPAILYFGRDVTELKQVESQVLQGDRLAALGTLAGGMAHAINNPLTYVLLNLEDLSEQLPKLGERRWFLPEAVQRLKEAHDGSERVANVVRQMRAFARSDNSVPSPIDVRNVVEAALALVGNELRHRGNLVTEYDEVPLVFATQARLEQALLNLLLHAARALPEASTSLPDVRVAVRRKSAESVLIEVAYADAVRLEEATDVAFDPLASVGSLDAGLAICHGIVTSLGGEMRIARQPGTGSAFRVVLPAAEWTRAESVAPPAAPPSLVPPPARARVLVIDDDPGVGNALRLVLAEEHEVTSLTSPREALKMLFANPDFDIVFCDLMMPELSGVDLYQALYMNRPGYERRLVFMTGGAFMPEEARFVARVKSPIIEKPFDMRRVQSLVRNAVARRV
jgi:PAS domain S-box-containing protein